MTVSLWFHKPMSEQKDVRPTPMPLPMVYESVPITPPHWEYRVLTIDTREEDLLDVSQLNELGSEGWLLIGIVGQDIAKGRNFEVSLTFSSISDSIGDRDSAEGRKLVHYYFVRQKVE